MTGVESWVEQHEALRLNPPDKDDVLRAAKGKACLFTTLKPGEPPFIYGLCYLPDIVGSELRWTLSASKDIDAGIKCILKHSARRALIRKEGIKNEYFVDQLKVVCRSKNDTALICSIE